MSLENTNTLRNGNTIDPRSIPNLPGCSFPDPRRTNFPVSHIFDVSQHTRQVDDTKACTSSLYSNSPCLGCSTRMLYTQKTQKPVELACCETTSSPVCQKNATARTATQNTDETFVPEYVALDRVVLQFYAWFSERVPESASERERVRHVSINYYVVDGTLSISEKTYNNSGMPQGVLVRRHRVSRDYKDESAGFVTLDDLVVGDCVCIYARTYYIYGCNASTRTFLESQGLNPPANLTEEDIPQDPYRASLEFANAACHRMTTTPPITEDKIAKFLMFDGNVMRFNAIYKGKRFIILFFLADDTIQILEPLPPNSGCDPFPCFLNRQRVPKVYAGTQFKEWTEASGDCVRLSDFKIGQNVVIFDRSFTIVGCDKHTKEWLVEKCGRKAEEVQDIELQRIGGIEDNTTKTIPKIKFPKNTLGLGTEEDSLGSCLSIHPEAPSNKAYIQSWNRFEELSLRFLCKLTVSPEDEARGKKVHITQRDRIFVLTYFLVDNTLSIFETEGSAEAGFGKKFIERSKCVNGTPIIGEVPVYVNLNDIDAVGKVVCINSYWFKIVEVDGKAQAILDAIHRDGIDKFDPEPFKTKK